MDIEPELASAIRGVSPQDELKVSFTLASPGQRSMSEAEVCEVADNFIRDSEDLTGIKANRIEILPNQQTVVVDASPLLIRALIDRGPRIVRMAALRL